MLSAETARICNLQKEKKYGTENLKVFALDVHNWWHQEASGVQMRASSAKLSWWSLLLNLKKIPSCVGYARVVSMFRELLREHENGEELEKKNFVLNRRVQNLEWNKLLDKPSVAVGMFSFRKLALIVCMSGNVMAVCITISCEIWYIAGTAPCVASLWISAACP